MAKNLGKYLETAVEKELGKNTQSNRHWRRLHDGRAAKTYMPAQPADFEMCVEREAFHLECKSQKGKTRRLKKFTQLADMKRWAMAGKAGYVLVHFWEVDELWLVDVANLASDEPSWVLVEGNGWHVGDVKDALNHVGWAM